MIAYLEHVMCWPETEMLKRDLHRAGAGAPEAGSDDIQSHFLPLLSTRSLAHCLPPVLKGFLKVAKAGSGHPAPAFG
jgi:hypothetical protein